MTKFQNLGTEWQKKLWKNEFLNMNFLNAFGTDLLQLTDY